MLLYISECLFKAYLGVRDSLHVHMCAISMLVISCHLPNLAITTNHHSINLRIRVYTYFDPKYRGLTTNGSRT